MNRKVFNTLEFNKIIERLEGFASSDGGKKARSEEPAKTLYQ